MLWNEVSEEKLEFDLIEEDLCDESSRRSMGSLCRPTSLWSERARLLSMAVASLGDWMVLVETPLSWDVIVETAYEGTKVEGLLCAKSSMVEGSLGGREVLGELLGDLSVPDSRGVRAANMAAGSWSRLRELLAWPLSLWVYWSSLPRLAASAFVSHEPAPLSWRNHETLERYRYNVRTISIRKSTPVPISRSDG